MKKILYMIALLSFLSTNLFSQNVLEINATKLINFKSTIDLKYLNDDKKPSIQTIKSNEEIRAFTINYSNFENLVQSNFSNFVISEFPVSPLKNDVVELKRAKSVIDENTTFRRGTANGIITVEAPIIYSFTGKIRNQENSKVFFTYSDGNIFGYVENNDGFQYSISSTSTVESKYEKSHLMIAHESLVPANTTENPFNCMTQDYSGDKREIHEEHYNDSKHNENQIQQLSKLYEVPLILEAAYDYYAVMGSNYNKAATYMIAVIAQTSKIYQEQINCTFTVKDIVIWDTKANDPYSTSKTLADKLDMMPSIWSSDGTQRALVSLFANLYNQPPNTVIAGISMGGDPGVGSLCSKARGYNVFGIKANGKYPTMNYTWDVNCATHEIGHNFSAPHTHNCYYLPNMIDTCVTKTDSRAQAPDACLSGTPISRKGTIMSYCHLGNASTSVDLVFHNRQVGIMRKALESSTCVYEPKTPTVKLLTFLGENTYISGNTEQIRWTASKVSNLKISWSKDAGATWEVITPSITAVDTIFNWTVPAVATTKGLLLLQDASDPNVADTSLTTFSISSLALNLTKPASGEKYAIKETVVLNWTSSMIDAFNIYSSSDNGASWATLATNIKSNSYSWDNHPNAGNYTLKVANAANLNYFVTTNVVLGQPKLTLVKPNGGEKFCWNQTNEITWTSEFINTIYLQYSIDNGTTWKNVVVGTKEAPVGKLSWQPAAANKTTQALIKISAGYDKNEVLATSATNFSIDSCIVGVDEFEILSGVSIDELAPNPVTNNGVLRINNKNDFNLTANIIFINELGETVKSFDSMILPSNVTNELKFNIDELANGNYFIIIRTEKGNINYPLRIFR